MNFTKNEIEGKRLGVSCDCPIFLFLFDYMGLYLGYGKENDLVIKKD